MILYNITINLESEIHEEWLDWIQHHFLPELMKTGIFTVCKLCRLLNSPNEGFTYSIQCISDTRQGHDRYQHEHGERFRKMHTDKFAGKFVSFESLMEIVEEYSISNFSLN